MRWSERYDSLFAWYGQKYEVPWRLLKSLAFAESGFDPDAKSSAGAMGLMQFMALTARDEAVKDPLDPEEAIRGAAAYMAKLHAVVKVALTGLVDDEVLLWRLAASAYNCGWGYVKTALQAVRSAGRPLTWDEFTKALPKVEYKGKHPDAMQAINHGLKVVPDLSVLEA